MKFSLREEECFLSKCQGIHIHYLLQPFSGVSFFFWKYMYIFEHDL